MPTSDYKGKTMKKILLVLSMVLCTSTLFAQVHVELPVKIRDTAPLGKEYTLTVGVDTDATACLDTALDEEDLPPPPPGFFPVLLPGCTDTNSGTTISLHKDYRAIPAGQFSVTYPIKLYRGTERKPVHFSWNELLPHGIDSAFLMIEFVDTLNLALSSEYVLANEFVTDLQIRVFYSIPTVGISEGKQALGVKLFPLPATHRITVQAEGYEGGTFEVYGVNGQRYVDGSITSQEMSLDVEHLPRGEYWIRLVQRNGQSIVERFVCW